MKILRIIGAVGAATAILGAQARAQGAGGILPTAEDTPNRQGTRGANFLHIGIGARAGAMAGAIGSSVTGPMSWYWNPGGASTTEEFALVAGRQDLYGDLGLGQSYAAASLPLLGGVIGFHLNTLNSGDIQRTTEINPLGERLGGASFQWTSTVAGLGYARRLTDRLSVGAQLKYIREGITDAGTSWIAADVGTVFNTGLYGVTIGGAIRNIGGTSRAKGAVIQRVITSNDGSVLRETRRVDLYTRMTEIPVVFQFSLGSELLGTANSLMGGAGGPNTLTAEIAVIDGTDISTQYALGVEYGFKNILFLRGGKRMFNDDRDQGGYGSIGLGGGFGLRFPVFGRPVRFDYSYQDAGHADAPGTSNALGYRSPAVAADLDSASVAPTRDAMRRYTLRAFQRIMDDAPAVWLYSAGTIAAAHRRLELAPFPLDGWWHSLPEWSIPADKRIDRDRVGLRPATP